MKVNWELHTLDEDMGGRLDQPIRRLSQNHMVAGLVENTDGQAYMGANGNS